MTYVPVNETVDTATVDWASVLEEADAAGRAAVDAMKPEEQAWYQAVERANPFDDTSPVVKRYPEPFMACGFAWVQVYDGNSPFARWLRKQAKAQGTTKTKGGYKPGQPYRQDWEAQAGGGRWKKAYEGGVSMWVTYTGPFNGQAMDPKVAYATAYAEVLRSYGLKAYGKSRLD